MKLTKGRALLVSHVVAGGIFLFGAMPGTTSAVEWKKIIDYGDPGYSETSNNWRTYGLGGFNGSFRYLSREVGDHTRTGTATWETEIPHCGIYRVSASFRRTENRTPDADYYVTKSNGGEDHYVVDQRGHLTYPSWGLGQVDYYYAKGQKVRVRLDGTDDGWSDCADAVMWELKEWRECPATPTQKRGTGPSVRSLLLKK